MIKSFDNSRTGSLDFEQFLALWDYLARWRTVFERFDVDKSLSISFNEYTSALKALGFSVEFNCLQHIFSRFSYLTPNQGPVMKLDSFVESMVWIMQITEDFKKFPSHDNGNTATISFSGFLDVILRHRDQLPQFIVEATATIVGACRADTIKFQICRMMCCKSLKHPHFLSLIDRKINLNNFSHISIYLYFFIVTYNTASF